MSSRGLMKRNHPPFLLLSSSLLAVACYSGSDAGGGPVDLATASSPPTSTSTDPPTTSLPTTSASNSSSTGAPMETTSTGSTSGGSTNSASTTDNEPGTSSSGTTQPAPSPSCGDAILDPGEECDLGAAENDNQGACSLECKLPKCGDHLIWVGQESCDNGPENNDSLYGGCTTQCLLGPRCGDGKLQGPEECDLGPDNGTGEFLPDSVPCTDLCRFKAKMVFLSSVTYQGGHLKSVKDADEECQDLAAGSNLDNATNFKAWVSDSQHSPSKDFTHIAGMPYVRPDGVRIAKDWDDLILNGPDEGIIVTEHGESMPSKGVWTGTGSNGQLHPDTLTCKSWTSLLADDKGIRGLSGIANKQSPAWTDWVTKRQWTDYMAYGCDLDYRIYCFEQ